MMTKLTDSEVASRLLTIQFKLRGMAHLIEYNRMESIPLDLDDAMAGVGEILNDLVGEISELRNLFDPSSDEDGDGSIRKRRRF